MDLQLLPPIYHLPFFPFSFFLLIIFHHLSFVLFSMHLSLGGKKKENSRIFSFNDKFILELKLFAT